MKIVYIKLCICFVKFLLNFLFIFLDLADVIVLDLVFEVLVLVVLVDFEFLLFVILSFLGSLFFDFFF